MSIFGWIIFALINTLILFSLDPNPEKGRGIEGIILGMTGALSGCLFGYLAIKGITNEFTATFTLVLALEGCLLLALYFSKVIGNAQK